MANAEERIKQKAKVPFDSKGFPLFADSFSCWRDSGEVTEKSLLRNGWVKLDEVLQILKEQKVKWRELQKLIENRVRWVRLNRYRKAGVDDVIRSYEDCFEKIEEKLEEIEK